MVIDYENGEGKDMKVYIEERAVEIAGYIIENQATVRKAAQEYRISKSTVHKDVTQRMEEIDPGMALKVRRVLQHNMEERHIRGGLATKRKYAFRCMPLKQK